MKHVGVYNVSVIVIPTDFMNILCGFKPNFNVDPPEPKPHALGHCFVVRIEFETTHKKFFMSFFIALSVLLLL